MATKFEDIRSGDLITADLMKRALGLLTDLEARVVKLEASSSTPAVVTITDILPSHTLRSRTEMTVVGRNFDVPTRFNTVLVGDEQIKEFNPGTDDSHLVFGVPDIGPVRTRVDVVVRNKYGDASDKIFIDPPLVQPKGELGIGEDTSLISEAITIGKTYTYLFKITSETDIGETYRLRAGFTDTVGASELDWLNNTNPRDQTLPFEPFKERIVPIQIKVPTGAQKATLILRITSVNSSADPLLNRTSTPLKIEVGEKPEVNDPRVTFSKPEVSGNGHLDGDIVVSPLGGKTRLKVSAHFEKKGTYKITPSFDPDATNVWLWENLKPGDKTTEDDDGDEDISVIIQLGASDLELHRYLVIKTSRTDNDAIGQFDSWTKIRIKGA